MTAIIVLGWGDSLGAGAVERDFGIDVDVPGVYQYRVRAPAGISSDITPLDQAHLPNDMLSPYEYMGRHLLTLGYSAVYLSPYHGNGSGFNGGGWRVGDAAPDEFIAKSNACIQAVAALTGDYEIIMNQYVGSNDAFGTNFAQWEAWVRATIAYMRAGIFKNGVSGADVSDLPYIINSFVFEFLQSPEQIEHNQILRRIAAELTNGKFYKIPAGMSADNLHLSNPGIRSTTAAGAIDLLFDTTPLTLNGVVAEGSYKFFENQKLQLPLTNSGNEYSYWTHAGTDAASFEVVEIADGDTGDGLGQLQPYLRILDDDYLAPGNYSVDLTAKDGGGNDVVQNLQFAVERAYGDGAGPVTVTQRTDSYGTTTLDLQNRGRIPVTFARGMNVITIVNVGGTATDVNSVTFNGHFATAIGTAPSGGPWSFYLPVAEARTGEIIVDTVGFLGGTSFDVLSFEGTAGAPTSSDYVQFASAGTPAVTASITCPVGGVIVGAGFMGYTAGAATPASGVTTVFNTRNVVAGYRTTTGVFGFTDTGYQGIAASAWAPGIIAPGTIEFGVI